MGADVAGERFSRATELLLSGPADLLPPLAVELSLSRGTEVLPSVVASCGPGFGSSGTRAAVGSGQRLRRGVAPTAGHFYSWRPDLQPNVDAVYDAGRLPLSGSFPAVVPWPFH